MKTNRILILTGGTISISFLKEYLNKEKFSFIIAADHGLLAVNELNLPVDVIVGDFDSVSRDIFLKYKERKSDSSYSIKEFNPEKDYTDTQIAIETAFEYMPDEIVIIGATGSRIDHMISNVQNLLLPLKKNIQASIIDEHNKIYLIDNNMTIYKDKLFGPYISLLPCTPVVNGVTLVGFKYPLKDADICMGNSIGVSNEVVADKATISLRSGILLAIESRD